MPKTESKFLTLTHPMTRRGQETVKDAIDMYESQDFMLVGTVFAEGSIEEIELRKTLDYTRAERRAAKQGGQVLQFNQFKGLLPDGYVPINENDPRLQVPPPAEGAE